MINLKCEKCHEREINFLYTTNINGDITIKKLCSECAVEDGLIKERVFSSKIPPFDPIGLFSLFDDTRARGFYAPLPVLGNAEIINFPPADNREMDISREKVADLRKKREVSELRARLEKAILEENFEFAISLRDEIRSREDVD